MSDRGGPVLSQLPLEPVLPEDRAAATGAMLFVASQPVVLDDLGRQLGCTLSETAEAVRQLERWLPSVGLLLQWTSSDQVQIVTLPRLARVVQRFLGQERTIRLSQPALEALAIVAYRQPVTRTEIEAIRGVDSSGVLQTLVARGLVHTVGRMNTVGNPVLYGTTEEFLRFFGLARLEELPALPRDLVEAVAGVPQSDGPELDEPSR